ncbi:ABC transporter substrate-binding protein [Candidatus Nitrosopumilus sediminis]|uniref:ABC transporter substrate-binding protein n=1 Tax=Candidatus Nitrosopumilus sediminis TaxID=1229909 RepID=UPI000B3161A1|nr:ABC transporter substrate-binding protein [Candidatus Nitrosopumilus sediminis]
MKSRSVISVIIGGIIFLSVVGVALNSSNASDENKLRIAYFPNIGHAIAIVGMEKGFFETSLGNTTQIETRVFDSGPQAIESLFANSIDLAYVGPGPAINGFLNSENHNVKILAGAASGGASFIVHPLSEINSASDFAGKKIAAPQIGNTQDVSLRYYLSENGLKSAEKGGSVVIYNIPNPDIYTLFVKGDIDGAWVAEPWATILETELNGKRLFHEEELWPNQEFASVLLIANTNFVEKILQ